MWNATSGAQLVTLAGHENGAWQASWNQDGSRILTASGDGTARQWYARMDDLLDAACEQVARNLTQAEWQHFIGDEPYQATCPNPPSLAES